jgi:hypothetical protein
MILLAFAATPSRADAQTGFGASVSTNATSTNSPITYSVSLTNLVNSSIQNVYVTNRFSSEVRVSGIATNYSTTTFSSVTNGQDVLLVFNVPNLTFGTPASLQLTAYSTNAVSLTNTITAFVFSPSNTFTTNLVTTVTNIIPPTTDLAVLVSGPPPGPDPYVGDWIQFSVTVTNSGTNSATAVVLSNSFLPTIVRSIFPTNQFTNSVALLNVGTLTNHASKTYTFTIQPTNAGTLSFSGLVASSSPDSDSSNNSAITNVSVSGFLTNTLVATFLWPTQYFNPENSLMEQRIILSNNSPDAVPSARVMVSGIGKTNRLFNAIGTNAGLPFVEYGTTLASGASVEMLLQYQVPSHLPFSILDTNLTARAMTNAANLTPPSNLILYTNLPIDLTNHVMIENVNDTMYVLFPFVKGQTYTIVYSDDVSFTTSRVARPSFVAPGNWAYWIDYGPPATISAPMNTSSRYYKVFINP